MEDEKAVSKSGPEPEEGIWNTLKDNAALVAAVLALLGVVITGAINTYIASKDQLAQQKLQLVNAREQRELEEQKAQNASLQTYLGQMDQMLLNQHLRDSQDDSEVRALAQAQTSTVLRQLDSEEKVIILLFLNDAGLLELAHEPDEIRANVRAAVKRHGLEAQGTVFFKQYSVLSLFHADFSDAVLRYSALSNANLRDINLSSADLSKANLIGAELSRADLSGADLSGADLSGAGLWGANLSKADLSNANLSGAFLDMTKGWTEKQLTTTASLEGAIMPDGQILKDYDHPDRPTFNEWLKDHRKEGVYIGPW